MKGKTRVYFYSMENRRESKKKKKRSENTYSTVKNFYGILKMNISIYDRQN